MFHGKPSITTAANDDNGGNNSNEAPTVALAITGSIAAYKAAYLCRQLQDEGIKVRVLMTPAAQTFVGAATFRALSGAPVITNDGITTTPDTTTTEDGMDHIHLTRTASLLIVAPASANFIAKAANGHADNAVLAAFLAADCPTAIAPAMNRQMWQATPTQRNIQTLAAAGTTIIGPASGAQACGEVGDGRMSEPEEILTTIKTLLQKPMANLRIVINTGATAEPIDTMRTISNKSSGKMGYTLAAACQAAGAKVRIIAANTTTPPPPTIAPNAITRATTNAEMLQTLTTECANCDIFISAAAIADYTLKGGAKTTKQPRKGKDLTVTLTPTPDILATIAKQYPNLYTIGFAALDDDSKTANGNDDTPPPSFPRRREPKHTRPARHSRESGNLTPAGRPPPYTHNPTANNDSLGGVFPNEWRKTAMAKMQTKGTKLIIANSVKDADSETCRLIVFAKDGKETPLPRQPKPSAATTLTTLIAESYKETVRESTNKSTNVPRETSTTTKKPTPKRAA